MHIRVLKDAKNTTLKFALTALLATVIAGTAQSQKK